MVLFIFNWTSNYVRKLKILWMRSGGAVLMLPSHVKRGEQASKSGEGTSEAGERGFKTEERPLK
ncbi:hypothetical protein KFZ58_04660 [Virgibacillus sp. NKC19-16]|uniref:hypothetical protein n=1 Tax=Virgibacillus salidurans TaxID=2831673 RepID=UPI001F43FADA|nr:hypothetical protein [Virgibacillus sp. NKC19-16]UJL47208.1 hypothetical protein KFZ58_04660 [Virgibacillus sp. NKC19-16]